VGTGGVTGEGARLMIRLQFGRGQATRCEELLHINKQLHGHRTYLERKRGSQYRKQTWTWQLLTSFRVVHFELAVNGERKSINMVLRSQIEFPNYSQSLHCIDYT